MLTDEDLSRELGAAFRTATHDLAYTGKRKPPSARAAVLTTTAFAGVAAVAGVSVAAASSSGSSPKVVGMAPWGPGYVQHSRPATHHGHRSTHVTMKLAGFTIRYSYAVDDPNPVIAEIIHGGVPEDATPVALNRTDAKAWSGTDAATGDNALYVALSSGDLAGKVYALLSPTWTESQLLELVENPAPVPSVGSS